MRIAILSDIHGNRTAFEAVLSDLRQTSPDLILHGGDLVGSGSSSAEIVDRIRDLGWQGVAGNTDEILSDPETFEEFAGQRPEMEALWAAIRETAAVERGTLGDNRIAWLRSLPKEQILDNLALVHASPKSAWTSPVADAGNDELEAIYGPLGRPVVVYGHIHRPFIRRVGPVLVINTGSVSLSYDGDRRAAYLLLNGSSPTIRRVEYDVEAEIAALAGSGLPHHDWIARILRTATPQMP